MKCPKCDVENQDNAKFCEECGGRLAQSCPKCGALVQATAKFCEGCGAPLGTIERTNRITPGTDKSQMSKVGATPNVTNQTPIAEKVNPASSTPDGAVIELVDVEGTLWERVIQGTTFQQTITPILSVFCKGLASRAAGPNIHFAGSIPAKKLENALKHYAKDVVENEVLALFDDTVFGSAKDGMLVTLDGLYARNMLEKAEIAFVWDIKNIEYRATGMTSQGIYVNGERFFQATQHNANAMYAFVELFREFYPKMAEAVAKFE